MAFAQHTSNAPLFNIRYSAFLGTLFLSDDNSRAAISAVKAEIGETVVDQVHRLSVQAQAGISMNQLGWIADPRDNPVMLEETLKKQELGQQILALRGFIDDGDGA